MLLHILSEQESTVLNFLAAGMTVQEVAGRMDITRQRVSKILHEVKEKFDYNTREQVLYWYGYHVGKVEGSVQ